MILRIRDGKVSLSQRAGFVFALILSLTFFWWPLSLLIVWLSTS